MNQLEDMIFGECMMLVSSRVLYLYAMCHEDDSGGTLWAQMCMKNLGDAIPKQPIAQRSSNFISMVPGSRVHSCPLGLRLSRFESFATLIFG